MFLSSRVKGSKQSVTLKVNERIQKLSHTGQLIYNMTAGQLPFKPQPEFIETLKSQLNFLKSYQYSPVMGFEDLRSKFINQMAKKRGVTFQSDEVEFDCIIGNGSKHIIYNILGSLVNSSDEVILITPYWVSYPEMIKFWGGVPIVVDSHAFDSYTPHLEDIRKVMSSRTKAIIINSPNNPAGIHYSEKWMRDFATFLKDYPDLLVISDELYSDIYYFDPPPTYFYQFDESLLRQTIIVSGISKSFACTGLRIGYCISDKKLITAMGTLQSQTTSGASSLIQRALIDYDFIKLEHFFDPVKIQLRECAQIVREAFREQGLSHCWYQTTSAFYFLIDFSRTPVFEKFNTKNQNSEGGDFSEEICADILEKTGVALVPGLAFGYPNSARLSMTMETAPFKEGMGKLLKYLAGKY